MNNSADSLHHCFRLQSTQWESIFLLNTTACLPGYSTGPQIPWRHFSLLFQSILIATAK